VFDLGFLPLCSVMRRGGGEGEGGGSILRSFFRRSRPPDHAEVPAICISVSSRRHPVRRQTFPPRVPDFIHARLIRLHARGCGIGGKRGKRVAP